MSKRPRNECVNYNNIEVKHTVPKMSATDREKSKKAISNDLYEVFLRIQSQLDSDSESKNI